MEKLEEKGRNVKRKISQSIERLISELQSRKKYLIEEVDALVAMESNDKHKVRQTIKFTTGDENVVISAIRNFGVVSAHPELTLGSDLALEGVPRCTNGGPLTSGSMGERGQDKNSGVPDVIPTSISPVTSGCATLAGGENVNQKFTKSSVSVVAGDVINVVYNITGSERKPGPANQGMKLISSAEILMKKMDGVMKIQDPVKGGPQTSDTKDCSSARHLLKNHDSYEGGPRTSGPRFWFGAFSKQFPSKEQPAEESDAAEALQRYRNKGKVKKCFGTRGSDVGQMKCPHGICSTASDDIVVADGRNNRIQIFDVNGQVKGIFGSYGLSEGQFDNVYDVCLTSRGRIVASDRCNDRIQIFDEQGRFVREFGSEGPGDGQLNRPGGVATDDKGLIYVCDYNNHRVQVFSENGKFVRKFGSVEKRFQKPSFLSMTSNGRVVVSDSDNHRVVVCDSYGRHLVQVGTNGSQFKKPRGVATDDHGNIIVCDSGNNRVQVFTSDGEFVSCFCSEGSKPGEIKEPEGVCVLSDGGIVVSDWGNCRAQIF